MYNSILQVAMLNFNPFCPCSRGLFTSDLTHLDDGNPNFTHDKLINFTKCVLIYNRIRDFMLYQVSVRARARVCVCVCACACVCVCMCVCICYAYSLCSSVSVCACDGTVVCDFITYISDMSSMCYMLSK